MKRPSKSGPTKGDDARSYYRPGADYTFTDEHSQARRTLEGTLPEPDLHVHIMAHEIAKQLSQQSPEVQALAVVALAFCQECRDWKNARCINNYCYLYISEAESKKLSTKRIPPYERHFHYTHLEKVMSAVRDWLKPDGIIAPHHAGIFVDVMPKLFDKYFYGTLDDTVVSGRC